MIDIENWLVGYVALLNKTFGERIVFVGIQGSYGRGEAGDESDIDVVCILDRLIAADLQAYSDMLDALPHRDKVCGFICGRKDLLNWEPADLFQLYYDTLPIKGSLDLLLDKIDDIAVSRAIRINAGNIYHACAHNLVHEKDENILRSLYKAAVFALRAIVFVRTGRYIKPGRELKEALKAQEKLISDTADYLKHGGSVDLVGQSSKLLNFAKDALSDFAD